MPKKKKPTLSTNDDLDSLLNIDFTKLGGGLESVRRPFYFNRHGDSFSSVLLDPDGNPVYSRLEAVRLVEKIPKWKELHDFNAVSIKND